MKKIRRYIEDELGYELSFKADPEAFLVMCFIMLITFGMPIGIAILILVDGQHWGWAVSISVTVMGLCMLGFTGSGGNMCDV